MYKICENILKKRSYPSHCLLQFALLVAHLLSWSTWYCISLMNPPRSPILLQKRAWVPVCYPRGEKCWLCSTRIFHVPQEELCKAVDSLLLTLRCSRSPYSLAAWTSRLDYCPSTLAGAAAEAADWSSVVTVWPTE